MINIELPKAKARYGYLGRIVVDKCPYCGKTHYHSQASKDNGQRLADCFKGEYILDFTEDKKS